MTARSWINIARGALFVVFAVGVTFGAIVGRSLTLSLLGSLVFAGVGLVVTGRKPQNAIGWLFLGVGAGSGLIAATQATMIVASRDGHPTAWFSTTAGVMANFMWLVLLTLGIVLPLQLFPESVLSKRWRPLLWVSIGSAAIGVLLSAFAPTITVDDREYPNPLHPNPWGPVRSATWVVALTVLSVCGLLALASTILRFRRSTGVERVQMRWFAFSGAILVVTLFIPGLNSSDLAFSVAFGLVPLSCGIAILRYHLYDIDRIISRTTTYAIVTGLLLATYRRRSWPRPINSSIPTLPWWSQPRPWRPQRLLGRFCAGCRGWWTAASTDPVTTPSTLSTRSAADFAIKLIPTKSVQNWSPQ